MLPAFHVGYAQTVVLTRTVVTFDIILYGHTLFMAVVILLEINTQMTQNLYLLHVYY